MTPRPSTSEAPSRSDYDYALVGGGLQNALVALAILARRPEASLVLVESGPRLGGNHTWCLHGHDVPEAAQSWLQPLIVARHGHYDVRFPELGRRLEEPYLAVTSERLHRVVSEVVAQAPRAELVHARAVRVARQSVTLASGHTLRARLVVDARGPERGHTDARHFQKFVGLELQVEPHAIDGPMLMDATVPQQDGFRFFYVLPLGRDRVLVEDTYYSDSPNLDVQRLAEGIVRHARRQGMNVRGIARQEKGVLPLPTRTPDFSSRQSPLVAGYAGGFFHPTTGYSLPVALRLAQHIAQRPAHAAFDHDFDRLLREHHKQFRYCCWLNQLLFGAFAAHQRYHVLERFYRLPEDTIRRFYSLRMNTTDRARILCGRPPTGFSLRQLLTEGHPQ